VPQELTRDGLVFRVWSSDAAADAADTTVGPAATPAFVLVHGVGMSHRSYRRLHGVLALSAPVHSLDLPGFGGLPAPRDDVSVARMADALADVAAALSPGPVVLVGHSMGAQWAVETAARHPARVAALVLIGPVVDDRHRNLRAQAIALARDALFETPRTNVRVLLDYLRSGTAWFFAQVRHMLIYPTERRLAPLVVPTLVVRGSRDPVAGDAWLARLADRAVDGELLVVPGHGHHVERSAPDEVARGIRDFLTRRADGHAR